MMKDLADFAWEIAGTPDGEHPTSLSTAVRIDLRLYDSGYTFDALKRAVKKDERAPEDFRQNFQKIVTGADTSWKLWLATIYSNRITFDFCREHWDSLYNFEVKFPKMLGIRLTTYPQLAGRQIIRETSCLMWGDARTESCRTQIEETHNGHLVTALNLYHDI